MFNVIYIKVKHRCVARFMNFMWLENYEPPFLFVSNYINFGHAMNPHKCPQLNEWKWRFLCRNHQLFEVQTRPAKQEIYPNYHNYSVYSLMNH